MRILVTGSTGFTGYHTVKALKMRGHQVVVLVRSQEKARALFDRAGVAVDEYYVGDIADRQLLAQALTGCDGCVHTAAITPMLAGSDEEIFRVNVDGSKVVIETAKSLGIINIVYLSSIAAIFEPAPAHLVVNNPVRIPDHAYGKSKALAELYVREQQANGLAIKTIYPGGIVGPEDPALSATLMSLQYRLNNDFTITSSGTQQLDVRDLAEFIVAVLEKNDKQPAQYLLAGHFQSWTDFADLLERVSGARLSRKKVPGFVLRTVGVINDIKRKMGKVVASPVSAETMRYTTQWPNVDNTPALQALNFTLRDPEQTFTDTLRWMKNNNLIAAYKVPAL